MLIHEKLPQGSLYPQLTQAPANYTEFLNFFRGGQTLDDNTLLTTADTLQTNMFKVAIANGHLKRDGNPIRGEFLVDVFLTDAGEEQIPKPGAEPVQHPNKEFCRIAVELAKNSIPEDGKPHPFVGAVIVKGDKIVATGFRGESGEGGDHAEFCAIKTLSPEDPDKVDLSGCTVYTTLEPCSNRKSKNKTACATRLINAKVERVVYALADKDTSVYGHVSLQEADIEVMLFPKEFVQLLVALNKNWSDSLRRPEPETPSNNTSPIAGVEYYMPGTSMEANLRFYVRPPDGADKPHTIEDASRKVVLLAKTLPEIAVEYRAMDARKIAIEGFKRQTSFSSHQLLSLT
jgi:pyrimidine deaminase RibD-like protein